jgi:hypothetical protein
MLNQNAMLYEYTPVPLFSGRLESVQADAPQVASGGVAPHRH